MTFQNPTYKKPVPQTLTTLLQQHKHNILNAINCARVGVIQSFDPATQTAVVQIAQQKITSVDINGVKTLQEYPLLVSVPVLLPSGGGVIMTFPIAAGDECIVVFNDRDLDNWWEQGAGQPPSTGRLHDLSDGICIVGLRNAGRVLANYSTTGAQLRTADGTTFVEVNATGEVKVHGANVYEWDVQGYGTRVEWLGGSNYKITNYTAGASITTVTAPINPPVIP